ncbi:hypothetical protein [Streptomyces olivaceoviridis]
MSELVGNAYRHTTGPASLRLTALTDGRLRVGVRIVPRHECLYIHQATCL